MCPSVNTQDYNVLTLKEDEFNGHILSKAVTQLFFHSTSKTEELFAYFFGIYIKGDDQLSDIWHQIEGI